MAYVVSPNVLAGISDGRRDTRDRSSRHGTANTFTNAEWSFSDVRQNECRHVFLTVNSLSGALARLYVTSFMTMLRSVSIIFDKQAN